MYRRSIPVLVSLLATTGVLVIPAGPAHAYGQETHSFSATPCSGTFKLTPTPAQTSITDFRTVNTLEARADISCGTATKWNLSAEIFSANLTLSGQGRACGDDFFRRGEPFNDTFSLTVRCTLSQVSTLDYAGTYTAELTIAINPFLDPLEANCEDVLNFGGHHKRCEYELTTTINPGIPQTNEAPSTPALVSPSDGGTFDHLTPQRFAARSHDPNLDPYEATIEIRQGSTLVRTLSGTTAPSERDSHALAADPLPPGSYTWRARSRDTNGAWSPWSASRPFTVTAPPGLPDPPSPNPSTVCDGSPYVDGHVLGAYLLLRHGSGQFFDGETLDMCGRVDAAGVGVGGRIIYWFPNAPQLDGLESSRPAPRAARAGMPSSLCQANGGTMLANATFWWWRNHLWLYTLDEDDRSHLCFRVEESTATASAGGRFTSTEPVEVDTLDMSACTVDVLVDPFLEVKRSAFSDPDASVCVLVKFPAPFNIRFTAPAAGTSPVTFEPDPT